MSEIFFLLALLGIIIWVNRRFQQMQRQVDELTQQIESLLGDEQTVAAPPVVIPVAEAQVGSPPTILEIKRPESQEQMVVTAPALVPPADTPLVPSKAPARPNPLIAWFTRMNIMVQIGLVVLFFGVGFLVKYAADQGWLSLELRLSGAALLGGVLAGVGWRVRHQARGYGLALIGGGIGVVYLTIFAAYRLYDLIPGPLAFGVFVALGIAYAVMALLNNAQILALMALVGGLLAPILAASEGGSHVALFSYYLALNAGILAIAWFKSWRPLNIASFVLVLPPVLAWGAVEYTPAHFASTEPFLVIFFLFYATITLLTAQRATRGGEGNAFTLSDVVLLFANPLVTLALQAGLVTGLEDQAARWLADTALVLALVYAGLALWALRFGRWAESAAGWIAEAFIFLATLFLAISIPLLYDPHLTAAIWAVLGAALHWLGVRRRQSWAHLWGVVVRLLATGAFFVDLVLAVMDIDTGVERLPLFTNHIYIGALILSLSALLSAYLLRRTDENLPKFVQPLSHGLLLWGLGWWFVGGISEIALHVPQESYWISSLVAFIVVSCVAADLIGGWLGWFALRLTGLLMLPALGLLALLQLVSGEAVWAGGSWYAWPLAILAHFFILWRMERWSWQADKWPAPYHAGGVWLVTFLLARLSYQGIDQRTVVETWPMLALLLVPAVALALVGIFPERLPWPLATYPRWYRLLAAPPLAFFLVLTVLGSSLTLPGDSQPWPYAPVLNPLTLAMIAALVSLWGWLGRLGQSDSELQRQIIWVGKLALGVLAFVAFNAGLARDIHHLTGVPFTGEALFGSEVLQTTYAIVWSVLALVLMFWANRRGRTQSGWAAVWFFGAAVLALTVLKLFVVDLANTGAIARIVSFMGVGLLIIAIAYFAPLPPGQKTTVEA